MEKMRIESAEGLIGIFPEEDVVRKCFKQIDEALAGVRKAGHDVETTNIIIIDDKEYHRKDWT